MRQSPPEVLPPSRLGFPQMDVGGIKDLQQGMMQGEIREGERETQRGSREQGEREKGAGTGGHTWLESSLKDETSRCTDQETEAERKKSLPQLSINEWQLQRRSQTQLLMGPSCRGAGGCQWALAPQEPPVARPAWNQPCDMASLGPLGRASGTRDSHPREDPSSALCEVGQVTWGGRRDREAPGPLGCWGRRALKGEEMLPPAKVQPGRV